MQHRRCVLSRLGLPCIFEGVPGLLEHHAETERPPSPDEGDDWRPIVFDQVKRRARKWAFEEAVRLAHRLMKERQAREVIQQMYRPTWRGAEGPGWADVADRMLPYAALGVVGSYSAYHAWRGVRGTESRFALSWTMGHGRAGGMQFNWNRRLRALVGGGGPR